MRLVIALLLAGCAWAQHTGRIEGRVVASTGEPLPGVHVEIRNPPPRATLVQDATSGFDGRFAFAPITPGTYQIGAKLDGYYVENATPQVRVVAEEAAKVEVEMNRMGSISGRLTGPEGEPIARATVEAYQRLDIGIGQPVLAGAGEAESDERGLFRMDTRPGRYYIGVQPEGYRSGDAGNLHPTMYPDAPDFRTARAVVVRGGAETAGIDIRLRDDPRFAVRGKAIAPEGYSIEDLGLVLAPREMPINGYLNDAVVMADGTFEFDGHPPGEYTLRTQTSGAREAQVHGEMQVVIGRGDVEDIELRVMPNVRVEGLALLEDGQPMEGAGSARVALKSSRVSSKIDDLGGFVLDRVPALKYKISVSGLPEGHYIKAARFGGQDVLTRPLDLTFGAGGRLDITVSSKGVAISGSVDAGDESALYALVLCWRDGEAAPRVMRTAGRQVFRFDNLPPGKYKLMALRSTGDDVILDNPQFRDAFAADTKTVDAKEGARESVKLKLIPREDAEREAAKFP